MTSMLVSFLSVLMMVFTPYVFANEADVYSIMGHTGKDLDPPFIGKLNKPIELTPGFIPTAFTQIVNQVLSGEMNNLSQQQMCDYSINLQQISYSGQLAKDGVPIVLVGTDVVYVKNRKPEWLFCSLDPTVNPHNRASCIEVFCGKLNLM